MNKSLKTPILSIAITLGLYACGGEKQVEDPTPPPQTVTNQAPTIEAIPAQTVNENSTITITASANDADGSVTSYLWEQTSGVDVTLSDTNTSSVLLAAPEVSQLETITLKLTVTDNDNATTTTNIDVEIADIPNQAPTIEAIPAQTVNENSTITITASANDADGSVTSYLWEQTSGVDVTLSDTNTSSVLLAAPEVSQLETITLKLTVTDNDNATTTTNIDVEIADIPNQAPTIEAIPAQTVNENSTITITASANDADGSVTSYLWEQTSGVDVTLTDTNTSSVLLAAPEVSQLETITLKLTVTDNDNATTTTNIDVEIADIPNQAPTIEAIPAQTVNENSTITITASANDADGSVTSYLWEQTSGVDVTLSDTNTSSVLLAAPEVSQLETITLKLTVTDNDNATTTTNIDVEIADIPNQAPTIEAIPAQTVNENSTITITASANDADGSVTSYLWEQTSGVDVTLSDTNTSSVLLAAPEVSQLETITLKLTVTDNDNATTTTNIDVEIVVIIPIVEAIASEGKRTLTWDNEKKYTLFYGVVGEEDKWSTIKSISSPYNIDWLDTWYEEYEFHLLDEDGNMLTSTTLINSSYSPPIQTYVAGNSEINSRSSSKEISLTVNNRYLYTVASYGTNQGDLGKGEFLNVYDLLASDGIDHVHNYKDVRNPSGIWHFANYVIITTPDANSALFNIENPASPIFVKDVEELKVIGVNSNYLFSLSSEPMHINVLEVKEGELTVVDSINTGMTLHNTPKILSSGDTTLLETRNSNTSIYPITNDIANDWDIGLPLTIEGTSTEVQDISNKYLILKSYTNINNVTIVNVSDQNTPFIAKEITIHNKTQGGLKRLNISDNTLYAIGEFEIIALDLSNINEPTIIGQQLIKDQEMDVRFLGEKLLTLNQTDQKITLYDLNIEELPTPVDMTFHQTNYPASRIIEVDNNIAIISNSPGVSSCSGGGGNCYSEYYDTTHSGINIYLDGLENEPTNIYFEPNNPLTPAIVVNNRLYAKEGKAISIYDVTDLQTPILLGSEPCCSTNTGVQTKFNSIGNLVLFNSYNELLIFDADEPNLAGALEVFYPNSGFYGGGVFEDKLILGGRDEVSVLDLSNPDDVTFSTTSQEGRYSMASAENGIFVTGDFNPYGNSSSDSIIYLFENGVLSEKSTLKSGLVYMMAISNEHIIYVSLKGLVVVNVSNPSSPKTVLTSPLPVKRFLSAKIIGTTLYLGTLDGVLSIEMP